MNNTSTDSFEARILELLERWEELRKQGQNLTAEELCRNCPELLEEVKRRIKDLEAFDSFAGKPHKRFPIRLNCPHCKNPIQIVDDETEEEVICPSCGSSFKLDTERTLTWKPDKLPRLGKFELLSVVGRGTFGTVYRAKDAELDRIVAVKIPRSGQFGSREDEDRFHREARSVAQLRHPGIVPVYEIGRSGEFPFIVTEFVEGLTLADALTGRRFGFRESAEIIAQVADALHHAHEHGIIHRDLKPPNIMLETGTRHQGSGISEEQATSSSLPTTHRPLPTPRLTDFGLAKRDEGEITVTLEGQVLGTPAYMSPEQARGEGHRVDVRSDVYSLGVILYELLCGKLPFRGNSRMLMDQVLYEEPRPPRKLNNRIPRDLETICLKGMAKEASRRYGTARELADDLQRFLNGEAIKARRGWMLGKLFRYLSRLPAALGFTLGMGLLTFLNVAWEGGKADTERKLDNMGRNLIFVTPDVPLEPFSSADAEAIRKELGNLVVELAPTCVKLCTVAGDVGFQSSQVTGSTPSIQQIRPWEIETGRFFNDKDFDKKAPVCVLGQTAHKNLFPERGNSVGQLIQVDGLSLRVVGVLRSKGFSVTGDDMDDQIFMPLTTMHDKFLGGKERVTRLVAKARSEALVTEASQAIVPALQRRYPLVDLRVTTSLEMARFAVSASWTINLLKAIGVSVCLLLGGIGLTYALLAAVWVRATSIRMWRAAGNSAWTVVAWFLGEAIVLALVGSIIGILLGMGIAFIVAGQMGWPFEPILGHVLLSLLLAVCTSIVFGLYPALKAARLQPFLVKIANNALPRL